MKIKIFSILLFGFVLAVAASCSKTEAIYNISGQNIQTNKESLTEEDVKKAILRGGITVGWQMYDEKPGHIVGTYLIRVHTARVDIKYDTNTYTITYKDGDKLSYEPAGTETTDEDGNTHKSLIPIIHKNYNLWIKELDRSIRAQLITL